MLTKIIFTLAVIAVVFALVRFRNRREQVIANNPEPKLINSLASRIPMGWIATSVLVLMVLGTALFLFLTWRDANEVIQVSVIDARSGKQSSYLAYQSDIDDRSFRTTDGRRVVLAETERMETQIRSAD